MKIIIPLTFVVAVVAAQSGETGYVKQHLPGRWIEDNSKRENLSDFLYYMGMNWFLRAIVNAASFTNEQNIAFDGDQTWTIDGVSKYCIIFRLEIKKFNDDF